jgi:hypothetical protein
MNQVPKSTFIKIPACRFVSFHDDGWGARDGRGRFTEVSAEGGEVELEQL